MAYGNLAYCYHLRDEFAEFTSFSRIHWKKKWKIGLKIACGNLGYYSLVVWMLRIYPVFLEFTDQMENRGKDGIWELSILLSLAGWTRRIYSVYLVFNEKKALKIGLKIGYDNLGSIPLEGWILRFYPVILWNFQKKKMGNRGKDNIWELRVLSTIYLFFFFLFLPIFLSYLLHWVWYVF